MEDDTAHELDIKVAHVDGAFPHFPNDGKSFNQDIVQRCPLFEFFFELCRFGAELVIAEALNLRLKLADGRDIGLKPFQVSFVFRAEYFLGQPSEHLNNL